MSKYNEWQMENDSVRHKRRIGLLIIGVFFLAFLWLIFVDYYTIATPSMAPTIQPGERVRIIKRRCFLQTVAPNDIIIFNKPLTAQGEDVYCKRVLGCPGDRIGTVDGHCWNDRVLRPIGVVEEQEKLRWMFDGFFAMTNSFEVFPFSRKDWNLKNWGPIIVPATGLTMNLDDLTRELYRQVIEFETGKTLEDNVAEYTFRGNYYFAVGDNAMSSFDSRYWGFIPEDFIIGIVAGSKFR